jgi:Domain of unknown function (DUF5916)
MKTLGICGLLLASLGLSTPAWAKLRIDGRATDRAWQGATEIQGLKLTTPDTGASPDFETRIRWVATEEGLAFHFYCLQDNARYPRRAQRQQRDNLGGTDRVNVMVDFDGLGQSGYNVTLTRSDSIEDATISNENLFNPDWDGLWYHASEELENDKGWQAELLIPWSSALMRNASGNQREIGLYVDRVIGSQDLRAARPALSFFRPQFLTQFEKHSVPVFKQSLLKVYPYITALADLKGNEQEFRGGVDLFWKPSNSFQLTAAINPDFGQVESDDLVVNFDAVETFFSDKRPFFTENQSIFVLQSPEEENLIYTRRVGGGRDDGQGASDIDFASKISGSVFGMDYGVFLVGESDRDEVGRSVAAVRVRKPQIMLGDSSIDIGYLGSFVERPFIDRRTSLHSIDGQWDLGTWVHRAVLLQTDPDASVSLLNSGLSSNRAPGTGTGGWIRSIFKPAGDFDVTFDWTRYDSQVDFNDLGFQRRNNFSLYEISPRLRLNDLNGFLGLRSFRFAVDVDVGENSAGRNLYERYEVGGDLQFVDGATGYVEINRRTRGIDDLISRGNGWLVNPASVGFFTFYDSARVGRWKWGGELYVERGGTRDSLMEISPAVRYWVNDDFNVRLGLGATQFRERILWRGGQLFGRFKQTQGANARVDLEWYFGSKQELRLKSELLSVTGQSPSALNLGSDGRLRASAERVEAFSIQNFGLQLRYRYKINQESDFFAVYSRGGDAFERDYRSAFSQFDEVIGLDNTDQFLLKLRYAF